METRSTRRWIAALVATMLLVPLVATGGVGTVAATQEDPETAEEYFEAFRAMEGSEAFETYSEFETIRSYAVSQAQTGDLTTEDKASLDAILRTLESFQSAQQAAAAGEYERALEAGESVEAGIDEIATHDESLATLVELGLVRFHGTLGDDLHAASNDASETPVRIERLTMAATAYERAEQPQQATEFEIQAERLGDELERDREFMETATAHAKAVDCDACTGAMASISSTGAGVFDSYLETRKANLDIEDAEDRAAAHGLPDREAELAGRSAELDDQQTALALSSVLVLLGYGLVVGITCSVIVARIRTWRRTFEAAQVDAVVPLGGRDD